MEIKNKIMEEKIKQIFSYLGIYSLWVNKDNPNYGVKKINLKKIQKQFSGRKLRELVYHHMQKQKPEEISAGIMGTLAMLNFSEKEIAEKVIDDFNIQARSKKFWGKDCGKIFNEIISTAKKIAEEQEEKITDEGLFNIFNIIVSNFVFTAQEQRNFREFAGINLEKELENIYWFLTASGAGEDVANKVIFDRDLLEKYNLLKEKGRDPLEVAVAMQDIVVYGNNRLYLELLDKFMAPKILIFENDEFLREIYIFKFEKAGFKVKGYKFPPKDLVNKTIKEKPDIIFMDIIMDNMDGWEAIKILKKNSKTKNIPIIVVSNLGMKEEIDRAIKLGVADFLIKAHYMPDEIIKIFIDYLIKTGKFANEDFEIKKEDRIIGVWIVLIILIIFYVVSFIL